jgi:hypothetical protein
VVTKHKSLRISLIATALVVVLSWQTAHGPLAHADDALTLFGTGADGDLIIAGTSYSNELRSALASDVDVNASSVQIASAAGFAPGQEILIIQSRGPGTGTHEFAFVSAVSGDTLVLSYPLEHNYLTQDVARAQVIWIPHYNNVTIKAGGEWKPPAWNGNTGGVLAVRVAGTLTIEPGGKISADALGYRGGNGNTYQGQWCPPAWSGEGVDNPNVQRQQTWSPDNGGPGGVHTIDYNVAGAAGGNGTAGERGIGFTANPAGARGDSSGTLLIFGGGGGGSLGQAAVGGQGGNGGGIILLYAYRVLVDGEIRANGGAATLSGSRGGGGGAGGWIKIVGFEVSLGANRVIALGGAGGGGVDSGGTGGSGRIRIEYSESFSGSTTPQASVQQLEPLTETFSLLLAPGWNLVSIPLHPENTTIAHILASIADSYDLVYAYDGCNATSSWRKYDPYAPPFANSLTDLDEMVGFWVHMTITDTLTVTGTVPGTTTISMCTGWNLVGYPSLQTKPIDGALASITGQYDIIYAFEILDMTDPWKKFDPYAPPFASDLTEMKAGQGYWVKVNQNSVWAIND